MRDELGTVIRCDMGRNTVLGKYMNNEEFGQLCGSDGVMCGNEDALLGEAIYYYQDSSKPFRIWEVFNGIHGDGMPWTGRDGKLTE